MPLDKIFGPFLEPYDNVTSRNKHFKEISTLAASLGQFLFGLRIYIEEGEFVLNCE